jgi:hypothetical protein
MEERVQKLMPTKRLVVLREGISINKNIFPIIIWRERVMEEVHHRDRHTRGPPIGPIFLRSWMNSHNQTTKTNLRTTLISMSGNITH